LAKGGLRAVHFFFFLFRTALTNEEPGSSFLLAQPFPVGLREQCRCDAATAARHALHTPEQARHVTLSFAHGFSIFTACEQTGSVQGLSEITLQGLPVGHSTNEIKRTEGGCSEWVVRKGVVHSIDYR